MKSMTLLTTTSALAAALASGAAMAQAANQEDSRNWAKMREKAIPASELLAADVRNFANPIGQTENLVLNQKGTAIQYVLFEVPYPYSFYTTEDGYVNYDAVDVDDGYYDGVNLMVEDANVSLPRDQLKLTRAEAENRLVDRIIGSDIQFSDGQKREIEDILINPKSGQVTHYVVQMDEEALFGGESRTVRANNVSLNEDGSISASSRFADIEKSQDFNPDYL